MSFFPKALVCYREVQLFVNEYIHDPCHSNCPGRRLYVVE